MDRLEACFQYLLAMLRFDLTSGDTIPMTESQHEAFRTDIKTAEENTLSTTIKTYGDGNILRITPDNRLAKLAFHDLVDNEANLDPHHAQYLVKTGKCALNSEGYHEVRPSDETTNDKSSEGREVRVIHEGHFRVSFNCLSISKGCKWAAGRGSGKKFGPNRNVDVLLAMPGSRQARSLSATHAVLQIHAVSGVWMLFAGLEEPPTRSTKEVSRNSNLVPVVIEGKDIWHGHPHCLCRPSSRMEIKGMDYLIEFDIDTPEKEHRYLEQRNRVLKAEGILVPDTTISGIPFPSDLSLESAIWRNGIGSGTFGTVWEGFDPRSGGIRAIKRLTIKEEWEYPNVEREIETNVELNNHTGLITLYDWRTSGGNKVINPKYLPMDLYLVLEKGVAFSIHHWIIRKSSDWNHRKMLAHQLVEGLVTIHSLGWMHRDITPMNILYVQ